VADSSILGCYTAKLIKGWKTEYYCEFAGCDMFFELVEIIEDHEKILRPRTFSIDTATDEWESRLRALCLPLLLASASKNLSVTFAFVRLMALNFRDGVITGD
jgi:hypothetical protein